MVGDERLPAGVCCALLITGRMGDRFEPVHDRYGYALPVVVWRRMLNHHRCPRGAETWAHR